jgi:hypothetical protein
MPEVDDKLVSALRQAKKTPMYFAFIAVGASDGVLIVSKKKVAAKEIGAAKKESGGKKVFRGRCVGGEGSLVFETAKEPPGALAKQLRAVIKETAGMTLVVETRMAPDLEDEEEGQESTNEESRAEEDVPPQPIPPVGQAPEAPPPPPPPSPDMARFSAKLKALAPVLQKVEGLKSLQAKEAKQAMAEATALFKKQQFDVALETLDIAEGLMKEALVAAANVPPPPPPPPPPPAANQDATRYSTRVKALAPVLEKATATGAPQALEAKAEIVAANKLYVAKDYVQANAALDKAETLIKQALLSATQAKPQAPPSAPPAPDVQADSSARFTSRLKALTPQYQKAAANAPDHKAALDKLVAQAMSLAKSRNFSEGLEILDQLETAIEEASGATSEQESEETDSAAAEMAAEFEKVLKGLRPRLAKALEHAGKSDPDEAAALNAAYEQAMDENLADNHARALDLLTTLDARVTSFLRNARAAAELRQAAGPENVPFLISKQEWDKARAGARAELSKFQSAVLSDPATKADPRYDDSIVPTVKGLDKILTGFDDKINAALDEAASVPADEKAPSIQKALDLIESYRKALAENEMIQVIDSGAYGSANIGGVLSASLAAMSKRLTKRLRA